MIDKAEELKLSYWLQECVWLENTAVLVEKWDISDWRLEFVYIGGDWQNFEEQIWGVFMVYFNLIKFLSLFLNFKGDHGHNREKKRRKSGLVQVSPNTNQVDNDIVLMNKLGFIRFIIKSGSSFLKPVPNPSRCHL